MTTIRTLKLDAADIDPGARHIIERLREAGYEAYLAGGAVRDLVMGVTPKDFDIATNAPVDRVGELFDRTEPVGAAFGVSLVMVDGKPYEVARFRTDGPYEDGRRPVGVRPADPRKDALRRDFTINALFYDVEKHTVTDYVGGLADIEAGIIRSVGDPATRFSEDRLRMLRAVRFAARLGFTLDSATVSAISDAAVTVLQVSAERIGQELGAMFEGPGAGRALVLLDETALLGTVLPEVAALQGVSQPPEYHPEGDVFTHTRLMLERFDHGPATLGMGILLHDIGKSVTMAVTDRIRFHGHDRAGADMAVEILRRYRFPGAFIERVRYLVASHMMFCNVPDMRQATLRRFMAAEGFDDLLLLYRIDCLASHGNLDTYDYICSQRECERDTRDRQNALPEPLITGNDLISLGYTPGPSFKRILDWVFDEQLEDRLTTRTEAIRAVRAAFPAEEA